MKKTNKVDNIKFRYYKGICVPDGYDMINFVNQKGGGGELTPMYIPAIWTDRGTFIYSYTNEQFETLKEGKSIVIFMVGSTLTEHDSYFICYTGYRHADLEVALLAFDYSGSATLWRCPFTSYTTSVESEILSFGGGEGSYEPYWEVSRAEISDPTSLAKAFNELSTNQFLKGLKVERNDSSGHYDYYQRTSDLGYEGDSAGLMFYRVDMTGTTFKIKTIEWYQQTFTESTKVVS